MQSQCDYPFPFRFTVKCTTTACAVVAIRPEIWCFATAVVGAKISIFFVPLKTENQSACLIQGLVFSDCRDCCLGARHRAEAFGSWRPGNKHRKLLAIGSIATAGDEKTRGESAEGFGELRKHVSGASTRYWEFQNEDEIVRGEVALRGKGKRLGDWIGKFQNRSEGKVSVVMHCESCWRGLP